MDTVDDDDSVLLELAETRASFGHAVVRHLKMRTDTRQLLFTNLIGLSLAGVAITSYTAGIYIEALLVGLFLAISLLMHQLIREKNWIWRVIFIGILGLQIESFRSPEIADSFKASLNGFFLSNKQTEKIQWLIPISAAFCSASFWVVFIRTFKTNRKNKKTLPNTK